jgi:hypothetical protein
MVAVLLAIADSGPGGILVWLWGGPGLGGGPVCREFLAVGLSWRGTGVLGLFRAYPPLVPVMVSATERRITGGGGGLDLGVARVGESWGAGRM